MARQRVLARSPLQEALIDIRVLASDGVTGNQFAQMHEHLANEYPTLETQVAIEGELHLQPDATVGHSASSSILGVLMRSVDGAQVAQFRMDGFSFSRLAPYTTWEEVFPEAMRLWAMYLSSAMPEAITRVAVRYINDIHFPVPLELDDVLTAPPTAPPALGPDIVSFLGRITLNDREAETFVTIAQTLGRATREGEASVILDIDAFRNLDRLPPEDVGELHSIFNQLRSLKNKAFFESITEAAAGRFE